jgi:alpha-tubulin N-acetyltransferase 1
MEFRTDLSDLLQSKVGKTYEDGSVLAKILPFNVNNYKANDALCDVIDRMGDASALAQGLHATITTSSNFKISDYILYIKVRGTQCLGIIKIGHKNLYVREYSSASMINIRPMCILDFYVHEKCQREGHGKDLYDFVLQDQNIEPKMLAYDRPSHKFLSFLNKHFGLKDYFPQSNNFVIFDDYFKHVKNQVKLPRAQNKVEYQQAPTYNPYGRSSSSIGFKQRRGVGVFTALGSQMMSRKYLTNIC